MPSILDPIPANLTADLSRLREALDLKIPPRELDRNLLIATWNIQKFGSLSETWNEPTRSPKRNLRALAQITEILRRFDVVAIQELTGYLKALRHKLKKLGPEWDFC